MKTTTVLSWNAPAAIVRMSNININPAKMDFTLDLETKAKGKRKFTKQTISGKISVEIKEWLTNVIEERIKLVDETQDQGYRMVKTDIKITIFANF